MEQLSEKDWDLNSQESFLTLILRVIMQNRAGGSTSEGEESVKLKLVSKQHIAHDMITVVVVTLAVYAVWMIAVVSLDSGFRKKVLQTHSKPQHMDS